MYNISPELTHNWTQKYFLHKELWQDLKNKKILKYYKDEWKIFGEEAFLQAFI